MSPSVSMHWTKQKHAKIVFKMLLPDSIVRMRLIFLVGVAVVTSSVSAMASSENVPIVPLQSAAKDETPSSVGVAPNAPNHEQLTVMLDLSLKHIYTMYLGVKACSEIAQDLHDTAFIPTVTLEEARKVLSAIDGATAALDISVGDAWAAAAPKALVTADGLKWNPDKNLGTCHRIGNIFKVDAFDVQHVLKALGSKTTFISQDLRPTPR